MFDFKWSPSEKKIARAAYDAARDAAIAKIVAEFKRRANAVASASEIWEVEVWLRERRKEMEQIFDYRYSQLPLVFARFIGEGYMDEKRLAGLSEDKLEKIRSLSQFARSVEARGRRTLEPR
jgi:Photoprotection regulator fluorescence recovery protein